MVTETPIVAVVIPTRDRVDLLDRLLTRLRAQRLDVPFEVVVAIDGPDPDSLACVARHATSDARFRVVQRPTSGGPGAARNTGWRAAVAPLVAFIDDDCVPGDDRWLHCLTEPLVDERADLVQGRTLPAGPQPPRDGWARTVAVRSESGLYETCNIAYRRSLLLRLDGFDESYRQAGEDVDLGLRARACGGRFVFRSDACVEHDRVRVTFVGLLRYRARTVDIPLLVARHPQLRSRMEAGLLWRRRHTTTLLAVGVAAAAAWSRPPLAPVALALWTLHRSREFSDARWPRRVQLGAGMFAADVWEVASTVRGAVRARTVVL